MNESRRSFMAATAVAAVGEAAGQDDENDPCDNPLIPCPVGPVIVNKESIQAASDAISYLTGSLDDLNPFTGPNVDENTYDGLEAEEKHTRIYQDLIELGLFDSEVFTSVKNLLDFAPNKLYADAKFAALEAREQGKTLEEAKAAARDEINAQLTKSQKNILNHWKVQRAKVWQIAQDVRSTDGLSEDELFAVKDPDSVDNDFRDFERFDSQDDDSTTLLDGSTYDYKTLDVVYQDDGSGFSFEFRPLSSQGGGMEFKAPGSGERAEFLNVALYSDVWNEINDTAESIKNEIVRLLNNAWEKLNESEYDINNLVSGTDLVGLASDNPKSFAAASADLATLNIPVSDPKLTLELPEANDGEGVTYEGALSVTGATDLELDVGQTYDPGNLPGIVYFAYNYQSEETDDLRGSKTILRQPFTITEAVDPETGDEVESVTFSETNQQTTDADVESLVEEIRRLAERQREIQEEQREEVTGGGFFQDAADAIGNSLFRIILVLGGIYVVIRGFGDSR